MINLKETHWQVRIQIALVASIVLGSVVAVLHSPEGFWMGWLISTLFLFASFVCLLAAWGWAGSTQKLGSMMLVAFLLRLGLGIAFSRALPVLGYDNPHQNAGYPFKDSYNRDTAAWELAKSDQPLWTVFSDEFSADQYGGLSLISAGIYRYLSPDVHRPYLILILAAFMGAFSIPFFRQALSHRWNDRIADGASWIMILYPEGIFYSISQMREPFLIAGAAIAFWAVLGWKRNRRKSMIALVASGLLLGMISWTVTVAVAGVLAVWFWMEYAQDVSYLWQKVPRWVWAIAAASGITLVVVLLRWFSASSAWDWVVIERNSERANIEIETIGEEYRVPFIVVMGVTQVVLPAAIAQPSIALWRAVTILRSAGWYILVPFLLYSFFALWKVKSRRERFILLWLAVSCTGWILISSARAGGDLWDNPRYRTIFLPWMATLAAWGWHWAEIHRDHWLRRLIVIEGIFLGFFTEWYLARYTSAAFIRLRFWTMVIYILGLSALVVVVGFILDHRRAKSDAQVDLKVREQ